jgi:hypothetical protein
MRLSVIAAVAIVVLSTVACGAGAVDGVGGLGNSDDCGDPTTACNFAPLPPIPTPPPTDPPTALPTLPPGLPGPPAPPSCAFPDGNLPQQIYPAPNALGVPIALASYVVADTSATGYAAANWTISFVPGTTPFANPRQAALRELDHFSPITIGQIPSPSATAKPQNTVFESASADPAVVNVNLLPNTLYFVYMWPVHTPALAGDACTPNELPGAFFTTGSS